MAAGIAPYRHHHSLVNHLKPNQTYFSEVVSQVMISSDIYHFVSVEGHLGAINAIFYCFTVHRSEHSRAGLLGLDRIVDHLSLKIQ